MILHPNHSDARPGRRIWVLGTSGAGKTTLARTLASRLNLRHIELDALHWQSNWTARPPDEFRAAVTAALAEPGFIVDGNYSTILGEIVPSRIDTVLWLDYPFALVLRQVIGRTLRRLLGKQSLWNGNRESLRLSLSRDSIILWVIQTHARRAREFSAKLIEPRYHSIPIIRFRSPSELQRWLARTPPRSPIPRCVGPGPPYSPSASLSSCTTFADPSSRLPNPGSAPAATADCCASA